MASQKWVFFAFFIAEKRFFGPHFFTSKKRSQIAYSLWVLALVGRSGPVADLCFSSTSDKSTASRCNKLTDDALYIQKRAKKNFKMEREPIA